jgi:uncharacterized protein
MNEQSLTNALFTAPVQAQERMEILDIIRGVALLGILLLHMPAWFGTPALYLMMLGESMWTNIWDTTVQSFLDLFFRGKFYTMFSFLFGLGFVIFYERAKARSARPILLFYKRLSILLIIGLIHTFFIWFGDILVTYALFGFLLPLFFNRKPKTILIWVVVFFSAILLFLTGGVLLLGMADEATRTAMLEPTLVMMQSGLESSFYAYGQGNFAAIMAQRTADTLLGYSQLLAVFFFIFPVFLLGVYIAKRGVFQNIEANLPFIRKAWMWGLIIGLPMSIVKYFAGNQMCHFLPNIYSLIYFAASILGDTGLSIFYMTSIILLFQRQNWVSKLKPFGYVGRMALSNYLLQSIIGTMIFYNYGLGLYGQIAPAFGMALALVIFVIQIIIRKWWLERYQFGPVEWLWKSLTYGKRFGMRK